MSNRVADLRKSRDWTQEHLAERAGVSQGTISRLENGKQNATLQIMEAVAQALNAPIAAIFDVPDDPAALDLARRWSKLPSGQRAVVEATLAALEAQQLQKRG